MEKEIEVAAKWWADQLDAKGKHDNGVALHSSFANLLADRLQPVSEKQRYDFREALQSELEQHLADITWDESNPDRASSLRCIGTDYDVDRVLGNAAEVAGIAQTMIRFPIKTLMWIDPGKVSVSKGYRAPIEVIWTAGARS